MGRVPCCSKVGLKRGAWTAEEDEILRKYIDSHGQGDWRNLPLNAGLKRCRKSCRLRWMNYLRPDIKRGDFSDEEEDLIIRLHKLLGNRWSLIAGRLPGRTDNEIKNYWNTHLSRKLLYLQKSAEPPTKLLRARKHKSSSKPTVETKDVISSPLSEKVEDKRNDVEAEIENCISSWEEPLRFENFTDEQHLTKHENLEDLYGLDSVDVNWIERGSEDVMEMERFSVETQPCMYWDEYCEFITVY